MSYSGVPPVPDTNVTYTPEWSPTEGRWMQEMNVVQNSTGTTVTVKYA